MKKIRGKMLLSHPVLSGILDKGDIVEIEPILSTEEQIVSWKWKDMGRTDLNGRVILDRIPDLVSPIGTFEGYKFVAKDGNTYTDKSLESIFGHKHMAQMFKKL